MKPLIGQSEAMQMWKKYKWSEVTKSKKSIKNCVKMSRYDNDFRYNNIMGSDVPTWGYIILYLVVIIASFVGNSIFLMTIKKNQHFRRTHHFFLAAMSIRDLIVTIMVIPFVIDSQVRSSFSLLNFRSCAI